MQAAPAEEKLREARLHWYGCDHGDLRVIMVTMALVMVVDRSQSRGKPKTWCVDLREISLHDSQVCNHEC